MGTSAITVIEKDRNSILRPITGLAGRLEKGELEHLTVEAIRKYRALRDRAEECDQRARDEGTWLQSKGSSRELFLICVAATIDMHAQQAVVSSLIDVLGYIPKVGQT